MKSQETTARLENILKKVKDETEVKKYMDKYTAESYDSFARYFNEYIGEHNLTVPEITERSGISGNYVYNIVNGVRNPGRDKIIALCIGAGMDVSECNRALKIAKEGVLYPKNERDARIIIAINNGITRVMDINIILDNEGLEAAALENFLRAQIYIGTDNTYMI